jgi:hypothetical protein
MRLGFAGIGTVLVCLFQFFAPTETLGLKLHHLNIVSWTSVVKASYRSVKDSAEPILYQGVGVISPELLASKFARIVPLSNTALKLSDARDYMYFDEKRLWASVYTKDRGYAYVSACEYLKDEDGYINPSPFLETFHSPGAGGNACVSQGDNHGVCIDSPQYVYGTHNNALPYLPALSPALAQYVSLEASTPQVCLWMSSANVSAGLHFDLEDNLLMQVSGVKRIVLVSPEALSLLHPQSSWHPHWRQASNARGLYSSREVLSHLRYGLNSSLGRIPAISSTERDVSSNHEETSGVADGRNDIRRSQVRHPEEITASGASLGEIKTWEATLHPGDMIFIPAGYYHAVSAVTASVSINAWFYSEFSELYSLLENAPLPFETEDSPAEQLTTLAVTLRRLLFLLGVAPSTFAAEMQARYEPLLAPAMPLSDASCPEDRTECNSHEELATPKPVCIRELVLSVGKSCLFLKNYVNVSQA